MDSGLTLKQFMISQVCPLPAPAPYSFAVSKCGLMTTEDGQACRTLAL